MNDTRTVHDPFLGKDVQVGDRLIDRLRGNYACGPHLPNGKPEFGFRQFQAPPIQHEAAAEIERLQSQLAETNERVHYAEGTAALAMKHRDEAEAKLAEAKIALEAPTKEEIALRAQARKALADLSNWCETERYKLGGIDGYDYRSGEEFGIRRVELQIEKKLHEFSRSGESEQIGDLKALDAPTKEEIALRAQLERLEERLAEARKVLEPFAACVFNDNGDVTIATSYLRTEHYMRATKVVFSGETGK